MQVFETLDIGGRPVGKAVVRHHHTAQVSGAGAGVGFFFFSYLRGGLNAALEATLPEFRGPCIEFQDVTNQSCIMLRAKHGVVHHIITQGPPAAACFH